MLERPRRGLTVFRGIQRIACMAVLATIWGCTGGGNAYDTSKDDGAINALLMEVIESRSEFAANNVFDKATMPAPAERGKYSKYNYNATEKVFEGDTAKLKVEVRDQQGKVVATKDWTATKADGAWKLQQAPLP
jgi:hypothetical protein